MGSNAQVARVPCVYWGLDISRKWTNSAPAQLRATMPTGSYKTSAYRRIPSRLSAIGEDHHPPRPKKKPPKGLRASRV